MKVGDKVVCVDDSLSRCPCCFGLPTGLILDNVYVVEAVHRDGLSIKVLGVPLIHSFLTGDDHYYSVERFRKLDELKQLARDRQSAHSAVTENK